jgi:hypothetical protein
MTSSATSAGSTITALENKYQELFSDLENSNKIEKYEPQYPKSYTIIQPTLRKYLSRLIHTKPAVESALWGPHFWYIIHHIFLFCDLTNYQDRSLFFILVDLVIVCKTCRESFACFLSLIPFVLNPFLTIDYQTRFYTQLAHNWVNIKLNKPIVETATDNCTSATTPTMNAKNFLYHLKIMLRFVFAHSPDIQNGLPDVYKIWGLYVTTTFFNHLLRILSLSKNAEIQKFVKQIHALAKSPAVSCERLAKVFAV